MGFSAPFPFRDGQLAEGHCGFAGVADGGTEAVGRWRKTLMVFLPFSFRDGFSHLEYAPDCPEGVFFIPFFRKKSPKIPKFD